MQRGGNVLNTGRLMVNTAIIIVALFSFNYFLAEMPEPRMAVLLALIGGLIYLLLEIIFAKYVDNFQNGGDNAYKYYSNKNYYSGGHIGGNGRDGGNGQAGGNGLYPYRFFDGKIEPGVSF